MDLRRRGLLKEIDFTQEEFLFLIDLAGRLRAGKRPDCGAVAVRAARGLVIQRVQAVGRVT